MAGHPIPMKAEDALECYFLELRHKLIDIAAGLDRIQRCSGGEEALGDYRIAALREAAKEIQSAELGRTERMHLVFSDPTTEPAPAATDGRAHGAYNPG